MVAFLYQEDDNVIMLNIYFIRHASANYTGVNDLYADLSPLGIKQSEEIVELMEDIKIDAIYSSDLPRSLQTVFFISKRKSKKIKAMKGLREVLYYGSPEIYHKQCIQNRDFKFSGGESLNEALRRFVSCLKKITSCHRTDDSIIVATHGTVLSEFFIKQFNMTNNIFFDLTCPDVYNCKYKQQTEKFVRLTRKIDCIPQSAQTYSEAKKTYESTRITK